MPLTIVYIYIYIYFTNKHFEANTLLYGMCCEENLLTVYCSDELDSIPGLCFLTACASWLVDLSLTGFGTDGYTIDNNYQQVHWPISWNQFFLRFFIYCQYGTWELYLCTSTVESRIKVLSVSILKSPYLRSGRYPQRRADGLQARQGILNIRGLVRKLSGMLETCHSQVKSAPSLTVNVSTMRWDTWATTIIK